MKKPKRLKDDFIRAFSLNVKAFTVFISCMLFVVILGSYFWQIKSLKHDLVLSILPELREYDSIGLSSKAKLMLSTYPLESIIVRDQLAEEILVISKNSLLTLPLFRIEVPVTDQYGTIWGFLVYQGDILPHLLVWLLLQALIIFWSIFSLTRRGAKNFDQALKVLDDITHIIWKMNQVSDGVKDDKGLYNITSSTILTKNNSPDVFELSLAAENLMKALADRETAIRELSNMESQLQLKNEMVNLAQQVAHDIRSPIMALDIALSMTPDMPEESKKLIRLAIQRIKDIAENILNQHINKFKAVHLPNLLEEIVKEKKMQYSRDLGINIELKIKDSAQNAKALLDTSDFKRVISNLVNNSAEALKNRAGNIVLSLYQINDKIHCEIEDDGIGIPSDVIPNLGQRGLSYKTASSGSGYGLGLYHAKKSVESWAGELKIQSTASIGTKISIQLPSCGKS